MVQAHIVQGRQTRGAGALLQEHALKAGMTLHCQCSSTLASNGMLQDSHCREGMTGPKAMVCFKTHVAGKA